MYQSLYVAPVEQISKMRMGPVKGSFQEAESKYSGLLHHLCVASRREDWRDHCLWTAGYRESMWHSINLQLAYSPLGPQSAGYSLKQAQVG